MLQDKLKNARLARGLSLEELAAAIRAKGVSISKAALSKYERGESSPPSTLLPALASALGVEPSFFFEVSRSNIIWGDIRKTARLGKKDQQQLQALASNCVHGIVWLEEALLIDANYSLSRTQSYPANNLEQAELAAERVRSRLGLEGGPVVGLIELLERNGVIVLGTDHIQDNEFDGLSGWLDDIRPLVVVRTNAPVDRLRFSLAHELGHLMLDCGELADAEREVLAHRFASAFLAPRSAAVAELGRVRRNLNLAELGLLKRKYGLSIQAWIRRAFDLEIINESLYRRMFTELSARGWRRSEPTKFDYPGVEETSHLKQYTLRALNEGLISAQRARELCPTLIEVTSSAEVNTALGATELLKLSSNERNQILEAAAELAFADYLTDSELTSFAADDFLEY